MSLPSGILLLADGRSPTGGLAHSGGVEEAVRMGVVRDDETLLALLTARLRSGGAVSASIAAAACRRSDEAAALAQLDLETDARMPSAVARDASRAQGRGLLRLARASWPHASYQPGGVLGETPHHALVLGIAVAAANGGPADAALLAALSSVTGPASAAVRLLGLDPIAVTALLARLGPEIENTASNALASRELLSGSHHLFEIFAEHHAARDTTLFAS